MMRSARWWVGLALLGYPGSAGAAVTLQATSATVDQPGDVGDVCVVLDSGGASVAGTQNDLVWDGSCATLSDASACRINPDRDQQLFGAFLAHQPDFTYRALVLSLSDVAPIPDGELYCCAFQIEASPGDCCAISVTDAAASDPAGHALPVAAAGTEVCVARAIPTASPVRAATAEPGAPAVTPAPGATGAPVVTAAPGSTRAPVVAGTAKDEDDGCQMGRRHASAPAALFPLCVALLLVARRRHRR